MSEETTACGADVEIDKLVPLHERNVNFEANNGYRKIFCSIRSIGLIEPLCVYKENGRYVILDGFVRYKACEELGEKTVPCLVFPDKEAYTFNRMVNHLSHSEEARMLSKSMETLDESTVAEVLGVKKLRYQLTAAVMKELHPEVVKALDQNLVTRSCAKEFTYVQPERQERMLGVMKRSKDYGVSFARALVLQTPERLRTEKRLRVSPWDQDPARKRELVAKLETIEKRYDFYTSLYRQYTTDLLKLCIYVRKLISNERVRDFLNTKHPDTLARFESILFETQGEKDGPRPAEEEATPAGAAGSPG